jgi:hypothetical protein
MFKTCGVICAATLLAACGAPQVRRPHDVAAAAAHAESPAGVGAYRVDSAQSELRLMVYRAGPMAQFGHNHVILNRAVDGWVKAAEPASASFSLRIPVAGFVIDDPGARMEEGADFSGEVAADAKAGTRHNMLSAAVLDADRFPTIALTSIALSQAPGGPALGNPAPDNNAAPGSLASDGQAPKKWVAKLTVNVAGHESTLVVPFILETSAGRVSASGTVVLRQSEMGLTPFSVMLGALRVQDELTVKFRFVALKT